MKRLSFLAAGMICCAHTFAQTSIVFNNDAFMVIDNGAFVVVNNGNPAAITQTGTGGRIVSESENDRLRWMVGTNTGTFVVPFATATGIEFPLTLNITGAGAGAGNITFSTYNGPTWDNNTYRPSDVTHMLDYATGSVNNSNHVIDRFWIVDPLSYTTKPSANMTITYIDAEHTAAGNAIVESNLGAQRFNSGSGIWGDYLPQGTINTAANTVSAIPVTAANFFRSWTLSEITTPLPIELLDFQCSCANNQAKIDWSVASEYNISRYHIMGSYNGHDFEEITTVNPMAGTGNMRYSISVSSQYLYYALETEEVSGERKTEALRPLDCGGITNNAHAFVQNQDIVIQLSLGLQSPVQVELYEASGKLVSSAVLEAPQGNSRFMLGNLQLAGGVYFVRMQSANNQLSQTIRIFK